MPDVPLEPVLSVFADLAIATTVSRRSSRSLLLLLAGSENVSFPGHRADSVLGRLERVAASTGSACHSGNAEMSPVLRAMGTSEARGLGAIRFSLGRTTTLAEVERVVELLTGIIARG